MKFQSQAGHLFEVFKNALIGLPVKAIAPVYRNARMILNKENLTILTADGKTGLFTGIKVKGIKDGSVIFPIKDITDILSTYPKETAVTFSYANGFLKVDTVYSNYSFSITETDFPFTIPQSKRNKVSLGIVEYDKIKQSSHSAGTDELKANMEMSEIVIEKGKFKVTTVNGHSLSVYTASPTHKPEKDVYFNLPPIARKLLLSLYSGTDKAPVTIKMQYSKNDLLIDFANYTIYTAEPHCTEKFPNIAPLIPNKYETVYTINANQLFNSIKRLNILPIETQQLNKISLQVVKGNLIIEKQGIYAGKENIAIETTGKPIDLSMNPVYLKDYLTATPLKENSTLQICLVSDVMKPVLFKVMETENNEYIMRIRDIVAEPAEKVTA